MSDRDRNWPARLAIDPTAFVAPGAVVVGEVTLGARASIWFNTVVRGDTDRIAIGDESNIQDNSTVHVDEGSPALIGSRVTVGHRAVIHGCVVEDDCLIGMGAVVLSGARIGAGSLIGAAALVREGQVIPPGSLAVGMPARVVGPVGDAHRVAIRDGTRHYVELSRSYIARGFARSHPLPPGARGISGRERGPLGYVEWDQLISVLERGPEWAGQRLTRGGEARWLEPPGPGRWCALEVLCHLRDGDSEVWLPRFDHMLRENPAVVADVDMQGWDASRRYREQGVTAALDAWRSVRARLVARLAPLGPADWGRVAMHSIRGPWSLGDMVRHIADHDLSHHRQMARALGEGGA
jgi:carbonic anhydrase/acetyltransferase-like protein (isoleucine patch superfamily)